MSFGPNHTERNFSSVEQRLAKHGTLLQDTTHIVYLVEFILHPFRRVMKAFIPLPVRTR